MISDIKLGGHIAQSQVYIGYMMYKDILYTYAYPICSWRGKGFDRTQAWAVTLMSYIIFNVTACALGPIFSPRGCKKTVGSIESGIPG